jgi:hypothetical protein
MAILRTEAINRWRSSQETIMSFQTTAPAAKKPSLRRRLKAALMAGTCLLALAGQPAAARSVLGDIGAAVGTAWEQTKTAVHQGSVDTGNFLQKGVDGVNHFADQVAKGFCDVMTLGQSSQGKAGCSVNGGVGAQTDGRGNTTYYTYNPQDPGIHYPVTPHQTAMPSSADLAQLDRIFGTPVPLQDWEKHQADLLGDLLKPGDKIGLPWAGMLDEVHSPAKEWNIRSGGAFLDYRTDPRYPDGRRWHGGLDGECPEAGGITRRC